MYLWGNGWCICSSQKLPENSLQIGIAKMVWVLDMDVLLGKGKDVDDLPLMVY